MNFEKLNDDNFLFYAASNYLNPKSITVDEFYEDLNHIKYVKRLFNRYIKYDELKVNLIINHLILLYNMHIYALFNSTYSNSMYSGINI